MHCISSTESPGHVTYQITGFDRVSFVSDIADTVPQDGTYSIQTICFEADGLQAWGQLTVRMHTELYERSRLFERLKSVHGLVSVREIYA